MALPGAATAGVTNTRITSGPSGTIFTDSATFTFTSPEDGGFQCRLDSKSKADWEGCDSPMTYASLADGPHTFEVRALNKPNQADPTPSERTFVVETDTEPPQTTIAAGPSGTIATDSAIFSFESSEAGSFECRLDSSDEADWESCTSPQSYSSLADGAHGFEVRATDEAGNTDPTPAAASFAIDTTPPQTTIASGPEGKIEVASASFAFESSEPGSFECRLDSSDEADWESCTSPQTYNGLLDTPHGFEVRAADELGNVDPTPAAAAFTVDTTPEVALAQALVAGLPKPVAGQSFDLEPVEGSIELLCPGESSAAPLTDFKQVPMGCLINTRHGVVDLTASKGSSGETQGAHFWGGVFVATQDEGDNQIVSLKLAGKRMCEKRDQKAKGTARISRAGNKGRQLWGSGKGNYTTSGSYGSATVRGTTWLVKDRCDAATIVKVAEGVVSVRDFVNETTATITAGQQYLAKSQVPRVSPEAVPSSTLAAP